jgi:uncharacterized protein
MSNNYSNTPLGFEQQDLLSNTPVATKTFLANVFSWMFLALTLSAVTAYVFSHDANLMSYIIGGAGGRTGLGKIVMFLPLVFVLTMSFAFNRLSLPMLGLFFTAYAIVNGISFSFIMLVYTSGSIVSCFAGAAALFAVMAAMGYYTNQDLTKFGSLMIAGLIGLIIMSIINFFMQSDTMGYIMGAIGVAVFTGLTAYDMQKLKNIGRGYSADGEVLAASTDVKKMAILGALNLYLDFVNIFLSLLRLVGSRK